MRGYFRTGISEIPLSGYLPALHTFKVKSDLKQRITMFQSKEKELRSYPGQVKQNDASTGEHGIRVER